jgi:CheY-like chemotaxis protein
MISAFQKACPSLAGLFSSKGNTPPTTRGQPTPKPEAKEIAAKPEAQEAAAPAWSQGASTDAERAAEQEAQRAMNHFFEVAAERVAEIRKLFAQVSGAPAGDARKAILGKLCSQARVLWSLCDTPGLQTVGKITQGLERLLKQISEQPSCLTPSTLRTTASSIVLLETLCKPGLQFDLLSNPPPRFLTIDDDPVCRLAISSSLEQTFSTPDHAEHGESALALAQKQSYDLIFLDIEMPGMNGFEVCTEIHRTNLNPTTPVVFVTVHSDFDSRAKASEASGCDLIAKPFLPSELTLKALTILIRRRLQSQPRA